jgi:hypothetical protein
VYHLELRKFPHVVCRFNQSEAQLRALVVPWAREQWVEEGERKWNANEATLTVLEGPKLSMPELAMGKGWRNAQRRSEDVTERVLAAARQGGERAHGSRAAVGEASAGAQVPAGVAAGVGGGEGGRGVRDLELLADSLALELLGLLESGPLPLAHAWALAHERLGTPTAAESLALGEGAVRSLLARGLAVLEGGPTDSGGGAAASGGTETLLRAVASWSAGGADTVAVARVG